MSYKVVVFDMDETLGSFVDIGKFWKVIITLLRENNQLKNESDIEKILFEIIDLFPSILRPNILEILEYLSKKKTTKECDGIIIYTNSQSPKYWPLLISKYFNTKLNTIIFDQVIAGYKLGEQIIEPCRTTHNKTISDLFNCIPFPYENTRVCFLDDQFHPYMLDKMVDYIYLKPYRFTINSYEMAEKYYEQLIKKYTIPFDKTRFIEYIVSSMKEYNLNTVEKSVNEQKIDEIISKKILENLEKFLLIQ